MEINEAFEKFKTIAVYGMSQNSNKPSHNVPAFMKSQGYNIIPINPIAEEILGLKVYKKLIDIPEDIDILNVFRPSDEATEVVKEAIERHKSRGDIKVIWLQEGIVSEIGKELAKHNGIEFIQDLCMYKEYN